MSEEKKKAKEKVGIREAIANFQKEMPVVKKGSDNPFFNSKYADLTDIMNAAQEHLENNELSITHKKEILIISEVAIGHKFITEIVHIPTGEIMVDESYLPFGKAQEEGSDITYNRRYAISSMLNIIVENEDDDGNIANGRDNKLKPVKKGPPPLPNKGPAPAPSNPIPPTYEGMTKEIEGCSNLLDLQSIWLDVRYHKDAFNDFEMVELERLKNTKKEDLAENE